MKCKVCGIEFAEGVKCPNCGTQVDITQNAVEPQLGYPQQQPGYPQQQPGYPQQQSSYPQPPLGYPPPQPGFVQQPYDASWSPPPASASFIEIVHTHGRSALFLVGIILFTAGSVFSQLLSFSFASIIPLGLAAIPIIGFWYVYTASKTPRLPEKVLGALTLFKADTIIKIVIMCLIVLLMAVVFIIVAIAAAAVNHTGIINDGGMATATAIIAVVGVVMLVVVVVVIIFMVIYYKAILNIIGGIRRGIMYNDFTPLRGVGVFSAFIYISSGISLLSTMSMLATRDFMTNQFNDYLFDIIDLDALPNEVYGYYLQFMNSLGGSVAYSSIFTILTLVGTILCVVVLNRLNKALKYGI